MKMFLLNHQQRVKKWLTDKNFIEATLTEQINAADELKFSLPLKARLPASFYFAVIPRPRHDDYLMFKIIQEQVQNDRIQYTCVEAAYDELKSYNYIKDIRPRDRTASNMLQIALQGTRWSVGQVSDGGTSSTNFYYVNTLEAIQKIVNLFNLEAVFSVSLDKHNARVVRRQVNLYSQQGERTGKRFEYGSNLLTVEREENSENLVTALIGRGKGEEIYHDADGNKTTAPASNANDAPDGYGRRINFADVVWSKSAGNPVDKPAGQEYVEDPNATAVYGFDDGKPRIGLEIFEDITDPNELLQATWKSLQVLKRPKVSFKASVMDVGNLGLGDTVAIIRHDIQIEYFTRVYKVTHNLLDEKQNTIELGDDFSSHSMTSTIASMSGAIEKAQQTAGYAATSANGKNTNFYSQDKPAYAVEGDLWYKDLGNGETDLYQYHDGNWILISSTRELNQAKKEIDQHLDNLKQLEKNKGIDIDEIKKNMKSVENTANQAFKNGETNRTDLDKLDGEITGRITEVLTNGGYATQSWTQGQFKLNKSSFDVQIANVLKNTDSNSGKIDSLNGSINGMNKTIDGINTNVGSNATKIAQLIVDLKGIQSTVASKADISQVNQKADELSATITKIGDEAGKDVITRINAEAGKILIKTGNFYLDSDTVTFSDKAFIPSAVISNISADKITTGTLNGGNINVINLNANSITSGILQGTNLKLNLNTGEVLFQHGRIISNSGTLDLNIDKGTLSLSNSMNERVNIQDGELTFYSLLSDTSTPYGGIKLNLSMMDPAFESLGLYGKKGVTIKTSNYNNSFYGSTYYGSNSGAGVQFGSNGEIGLNGSSTVNISGGTPVGSTNAPSYIKIGTDASFFPQVGNHIVLSASYVHIFSNDAQTTSYASNVYMNGENVLIRSTSASKYKTDIQRSYVWDYGAKLLELPTATWIDKGELSRFNSGKSKLKPALHFGMIAEDLADAGLEMLVQRNPEGGLEGIQYDRIGPALIPVIKNLKDRIEKLEEKLNEQQ